MDELFAQMQQLVYRILSTVKLFSWCTVISYDAATHTCQVRVEPADHTYPSVPVLVPFRGMLMPHAAGMQGCCLTLGGVPQVLLGVTYTTRDPLPPKGLMLEEPLLVMGDVTVAGGLYLGVCPELPAIIAAYKYATVIVSERPIGQPNARPARVYSCLPSTDGSLHWTIMASAP